MIRRRRGKASTPIFQALTYYYIQGEFSNAQIAKLLGVCVSVVDRSVRKLSPKIKTLHTQALNKAHDKKIAELQRLRDLGATIDEIADATGTSATFISKFTNPPSGSCPANIGNRVLSELEEIAVAIDYLEIGATTRTVAKKHGISHDTVARVVKKQGVEAKPQYRNNGKRKPKPIKPEVIAARSMRDGGLKYREISEVLGVHISTVYNWCKKAA